MANPMMQLLNRSKMSGGNNLLSNIAMVKRIMQSGDPSQIVQAEMQRNPQFAEFVRAHQGKSAEDLLAESGMDMSVIKSLLG